MAPPGRRHADAARRADAVVRGRARAGAGAQPRGAHGTGGRHAALAQRAAGRAGAARGSGAAGRAAWVQARRAGVARRAAAWREPEKARVGGTGAGAAARAGRPRGRVRPEESVATGRAPWVRRGGRARALQRRARGPAGRRRPGPQCAATAAARAFDGPAGSDFFIRNISGIAARKTMPMTQNASINACMAACRCTMP